MKKKTILVAAIAVMLVAALVVGGTLAYFTDTKSADNTFTVGDVKIALSEKMHDGTAYVDKQTLIPGSNTENVVEKNVIVTNTGSQEAWVWVDLLIPKELYASKTETEETSNALHYNQFKDYLVGYTENSTNKNAVECEKTWKGDHAWNLAKYVGETEDGKYAIIRITHAAKVASGEATTPAVSQFYMENDVKQCNEHKNCMLIPTLGADLKTITGYTHYSGSWEVIVNAYAIQDAGFANVDAAVAAYNAQK